MLATVVDGVEGDAVVREADEVAVAEDLEATRVSEDGAMPLHEVMEAPQTCDHVRTGTHGKVIGIGKHDLGTELRERGRQDSLDRGLGAHRHEDGGRHIAVGGVEDAGPRLAGGVSGLYVI